MRLLPALALLGCVRAEDCPATELCWDDEKFGVWDCDEEPAPIQVYKNDDDVYVVEKLDVATGTYENIFSLELGDVKKINAAAIYHHTSEDGDDEFFSFEGAKILPAPDPAVPIVIGGRADAAVRRAALLGDGWLGVWCSPRRFGAVVQEIDALAAERSAPRRGRARIQRLGRSRRTTVTTRRDVDESRAPVAPPARSVTRREAVFRAAAAVPLALLTKNTWLWSLLSLLIFPQSEDRTQMPLPFVFHDSYGHFKNGARTIWCRDD